MVPERGFICARQLARNRKMENEKRSCSSAQKQETAVQSIPKKWSIGCERIRYALSDEKDGYDSHVDTAA